MRMAFLTEFPIHRTSNAHYYMAKAIQRAAPGSITISSGDRRVRWTYRLARRLLARDPLAHAWAAEPAVLDFFQREVRRRGPFDMVLGFMMSRVFARAEFPCPFVHLSDATAVLLRDYYGMDSRRGKAELDQWEEGDRDSVRRAAACIYSSHWAARSAIDDYGCSAADVHVVPLGANLDEDPLPGGRLCARQWEPGTTLELLFIGNDFKRKGGDVAFETAELLNRRGINTRLHMVGSSAGITAPPCAVNHGMLDKTRADHSQTLRSLMFQSHFLLLPTWADCSPHVICEAYAHGLPAAARDTGGVGELVRCGQTGILLPRDATAGDFARAIQGAAADARLPSLSAQARRWFEEQLNWDAWAREVIRIASGSMIPSHRYPREAFMPA